MAVGAFVDEAALAVHLAVVAGKDNERVIPEAAVAKRGRYLADSGVEDLHLEDIEDDVLAHGRFVVDAALAAVEGVDARLAGEGGETVFGGFAERGRHRLRAAGVSSARFSYPAGIMKGWCGSKKSTWR